MDRMLYIAMNGASNTLQAQATNANNLANATTTGFRADLDAFRALPVYGPTHASRVYSQDERVGHDFRPGPMMTTGRDLDVAINGEGWIAVQAPDGQEAYTRAGNLRIGANGQLTNGAGHAILGDAGPIAIPPADKIDIAPDGSISIIPQGGAANEPAVIDRIRLVNPDTQQMFKREDGLFGLPPDQLPEPDAAVTLSPGVLEGSNVNTVDAMVKMIQYGRMFEMQSKMMKTAQENDATSTRLLRLQG
ncbi:MAG: flagellar basal-body rod protein FlgF [Halothiobacillaceae bacterium]